MSIDTALPEAYSVNIQVAFSQFVFENKKQPFKSLSDAFDPKIESPMIL